MRPEWASASEAEDVQQHAKFKPHRRKVKENVRADSLSTTASTIRWCYTEPRLPTGHGQAFQPIFLGVPLAIKKKPLDAMLEKLRATIADGCEPANLAIACSPALHAG